MIVINENAEERLVKALSAVKERHSSYRCIYLKFSGCAHFDPTENLNALCKTIDDIMEHPKGYILVCEDKDVFIVAHDISHKKFKKLGDYFLEETQDPLVSDIDDLAKFYDLDQGWLTLIELAEAKLNKKILVEQNAQNKIETELKEKQRKSILNIPFNQDLVDTINQRRKAREEIEILFVEDDAFSRQLVNRSLNDSYTMHLVGDGHDGLMTYVSHAPDVVFLDIDLPDITGHDVLQKILEMDKHAFVVMLSGKSSRENIMDALQHGAKGFIGKPFTKQKLLQYIEKSLKFKLQKK